MSELKKYWERHYSSTKGKRNYSPFNLRTAVVYGWVAISVDAVLQAFFYLHECTPSWLSFAKALPVDYPIYMLTVCFGLLASLSVFYVFFVERWVRPSSHRALIRLMVGDRLKKAKTLLHKIQMLVVWATVSWVLSGADISNTPSKGVDLILITLFAFIVILNVFSFMNWMLSKVSHKPERRY